MPWIKPLGLLLIALSTTPVSWAKCAASGQWAWPTDSVLPANGLIVLEGYGFDRDATHQVESGDFFLDCGDAGEIDLHPLHVAWGGLRISQALLSSDASLPVGATCVLHKKSEDERIARREFRSWLIEKAHDSGLTGWSESPTLIEKKYSHLGCGPAIRAHFSVPTFEKATLILAEVERVDSEERGQRSSYLLPVEEGRVAIGHGMCSGAFDLEPGAPYRLWLTAMFADGEEAAPRTGPVEFEAPLPTWPPSP